MNLSLNIKNIKESISSGRFLYNNKLALTLWFGLSFFAVIQTFFQSQGIPNNYIIFKSVFLHIIEHKNLYLHYPKEYIDVNLYGPFFSVVIAPFALMPDWLGVTLWEMGLAYVLYRAIKKLPLSAASISMVLLLSAHELMNASSWTQVNQLICFCIVFSFYFINKEKEEWAAFFILFGAFIKIYSIVGLAFFFFSKKPLKFILWLIIWSLVFIALPMLITKPSFVLQCYTDWKEGLIVKEAVNIDITNGNDYQDISVMGMIRRIFHYKDLNDMYVLITALFFFCTQYIRYNFFSDMRYRLYLLCSVLLFVVIFSNGSESPTYIIAFPAVCMWYALQIKTKWTNAIMIFGLLVTSFSYSDLLTPWFRTYIARPYSIKALPCFVLWIIILIQIWTKQFLQITLPKTIED